MSSRSVMTASEESIAFYVAIGQAVNYWSNVEQGLFLVVASSFKKRDPHMHASGFFSIENFRSKLGFTDRIVKASSASAKCKDDWGEQFETVRGLSQVRNKIVHGRVYGYPMASPGRRYAVVPVLPKPSRLKSKVLKPPSGSLCVRDIDLAARQFSRAFLMLGDLSCRIEGREGLRAEHVPPEPQPRTLVQLRRQMQATLEPPSLPSDE